MLEEQKLALTITSDIVRSIVSSNENVHSDLSGKLVAEMFETIYNKVHKLTR